MTTIVSGTDSNIPTLPSSQPQKINDKNTTKVDKPKPLPKNRGSIIFPITIFTTTKPSPARPAFAKPNSTNAMSTAGTAAIIEPILGIKFNINESTAHNIKWSTPSNHSQKPMSMPVPRLTNILMPRYSFTDVKNSSICLSSIFGSDMATCALRGMLSASNSMKSTVSKIKNTFDKTVPMPVIKLVATAIAVPGSRCSLINSSLMLILNSASLPKIQANSPESCSR